MNFYNRNKRKEQTAQMIEIKRLTSIHLLCFTTKHLLDAYVGFVICHFSNYNSHHLK